jgi:hypothetical protein
MTQTLYAHMNKIKKEGKKHVIKYQIQIKKNESYIHKKKKMISYI